MVSKKDQEKIKKWMDEADAKIDNKDFEGAITLLDQVIELDPQNDFAWSKRGYAKAILGQLEEAIKDFDQAIELDPKQDIPWFNRGNVKAQLRELESAIKDYDQAILLNSTIYIAWFNRGFAKAQLEQYQDATKDFDQVIKLDLKDNQAWFYRGLSKAHLGHPEVALYDFIEAKTINRTESNINNLIKKTIDNIKNTSSKSPSSNECLSFLKNPAMHWYLINFVFIIFVIMIYLFSNLLVYPIDPIYLIIILALWLLPIIYYTQRSATEKSIKHLREYINNPDVQMHLKKDEYVKSSFEEIINLTKREPITDWLAAISPFKKP